jgi:predicted RNase H-like HicB family nuclease
MATEQNYTVRVHSEEGMLWAEVLELPGCFASGENESELLEALAEAIGMYLSDDGTDVRLEWGPEIESFTERKVLVDH